MSVEDYAKGPFLSLARVTRAGNMVVNVEVGNEAWQQRDDEWFYFIETPDKDGGHACIGLPYNPSTGLFDQPPLPEQEQFDADAYVSGKTTRKKS